ncbi:MAG: hypothetical protein Q8T09_06270 [Candidatus Melainabacteria bacterium]|nr:hypothetical protein [Candidatus Melainabacteria bacterium]
MLYKLVYLPEFAAWLDTHKQQAVIIIGGNKQGDKRWYDKNIPIAEKLFKEHLESQQKN